MADFVCRRTKNNKLKIHCWSNKNSERVYEVSMYSSKTFLFDCDVCNKEFKMPLNYVLCGHWCPSCSKNPLPPKCNYTIHMGKSFAGFT